VIVCILARVTDVLVDEEGECGGKTKQDIDVDGAIVEVRSNHRSSQQRNKDVVKCLEALRAHAGVKCIRDDGLRERDLVSGLPGCHLT